MNRGIFLLAQNTQENYVRQACLCAASIKKSNPDLSVTIATNDFIPEKYKKYFDNILDIPGEDLAVDETWKVSNRAKIYKLSPYDETIVLDTDMIVLTDISEWWNQLKDYDVYFTSKPTTYRGEVVTSNFYRKTFVKNDLPSVYVGVHYFKKTEFATEFFTWLETIVINWKEFYKQHLEYARPEYCSIDVCAAIAVKILDCYHKVTSTSALYPTFTHMKPKAQNWLRSVSSWQDYVGAYLSDDYEFRIGNYKQTGVFHYTEKSFTKFLEEKFKELNNG